jgi:hypothetical protein
MDGLLRTNEHITMGTLGSVIRIANHNRTPLPRLYIRSVRFGILLAFWELTESLGNSDQHLCSRTCWQGWYMLGEHC